MLSMSRAFESPAHTSWGEAPTDARHAPVVAPGDRGGDGLSRTGGNGHLVPSRLKIFHRGASASSLILPDGRRKQLVVGKAPLAQPESSELQQPESRSMASARSNDALPALKTMMAAIPPPPPALTRDERGALLERMAFGLEGLTRQLMAPRSWKERWLPRWLRSRPAVKENTILKWATYAVDRAADFAREGQGRNGSPAEVLELCRDWMDRRHRQGTPDERARWSWRLKDPKGMFGAAQAHLAQEAAKLGSYGSWGSGMGRSQWDTARARLDATCRVLTELAMGK